MSQQHKEVRSRLEVYRTEKQCYVAEGASLKDPKNEVHSRVEVCEDPASLSSSQRHCESGNHPQKGNSWWITGLKILLWLLVWGFFIEVEFGLVYFVLSGFVFIVMSLRGGRKRESGELSAYSVFNKNFEVIDGTLSAEQFDRELRYGPGSV